MMKKGSEIKLCSNNTWCPVVCFNGKEVLIKDDYGNEVRFSKDHWNDFIEKVNNNILDKIE